MSQRVSGFDPSLRDEFRRRLLEAREVLLRSVAATDEEIADLEAAPGPGDQPDHAAAVSTALLASRLAGQDKRELDEVVAALRRLQSGTYGACESCHNPITLARLRAVPAARYCLHCQASQEVVP
jgi:RNA polymerase-binding protein DksA